MNFERARFSSVNPDLVKERQAASFDPNALTQQLYDKAALEGVNQLKQMIAENPVFDLRDLWHLSKADRYMKACERGEEFVRIARSLDLYNKSPELLQALEFLAGEDFFPLLHITMFTTCVEALADDEQRRWWVGACKDFRILGTYAQTELGHGSNVAGLETTADLDFATDEWVLNTPTLESTKWWPGGLAKSATHCVLMARTRIRGQDVGVHGFMLPVRDGNTHESLKGVQLLDIGSKLGYNGMDNGGLQLHGVRIPRRYLLSRYVSVDREGNFKKSKDQKMLYATMTYTRKTITSGAGFALARAAVIATRYSAVRRQFAANMEDLESRRGGVVESQVLDYSTQLYAVLPMLATATAFHLTGRWLDRFYTEFNKEIEGGDLSRLSEMHVVTSATKAHFTHVVSEGIEVCRRACGGHGYLLAAGLPLHYTSYVPQATYEGDFVVLSIQTGRAILRMIQAKMMGSKEETPTPHNTMRYIWDFDPRSIMSHKPTPPNWSDKNWQLDAYKRRACVVMYMTAKKFQDALQSGMDMLAALDSVKIEMTRMTVAHSHVIALTQFVSAVEDARRAGETNCLSVLDAQRSLYALYWMEKDYGQFITCGAVPASADLPDALMVNIKKLLASLRREAVALADAWAFPDYLLNSALGRWDGNVYEAIYNSCLDDPNNKTDVHPGYYRHIQYILHPERKRSSRL